MGLSRGSSRGHFSVGGNEVASLDPPHGKSMEAVGGDRLSRRGGRFLPSGLQGGAQPKGHRGKGLCESTSLFPVYPTRLRSDGGHC